MEFTVNCCTQWISVKAQFNFGFNYDEHIFVVDFELKTIWTLF